LALFAIFHQCFVTDSLVPGRSGKRERVPEGRHEFSGTLQALSNAITPKHRAEEVNPSTAPAKPGDETKAVNAALEAPPHLKPEFVRNL
jgi:hypothetical protein